MVALVLGRSSSLSWRICLIEKELRSIDATDLLCTSFLGTSVAVALIAPQSQTEIVSKKLNLILYYWPTSSVITIDKTDFVSIFHEC